MSEKIYTFNRRLVADQYVHVRATSVAEAWAKARARMVEEASDQEIVKETLRRITTEDAA